ncbi:hypothetical protein EYF80_054549 [Liparis tanakae]|uniref:Uncharacterized protein n=1 Tax=Liparis tanakae TaxID=230148 RepID=A0A4Z2F2L6_9TELE|nr:hypothetical protein EYF80_054549 [Liparis tanakae]
MTSLGSRGVGAQRHYRVRPQGGARTNTSGPQVLQVLRGLVRVPLDLSWAHRLVGAIRPEPPPDPVEVWYSGLDLDQELSLGSCRDGVGEEGVLSWLEYSSSSCSSSCSSLWFSMGRDVVLVSGQPSECSSPQPSHLSEGQRSRELPAPGFRRRPDPPGLSGRGTVVLVPQSPQSLNTEAGAPGGAELHHVVQLTCAHLQTVGF